MDILVLPVSGGYFVSQCAAIQRLCETYYKPDVCMASSGGNVSAYIAAAAEWQYPCIKRVAEDLNNGIFSKPWFPISFISSICGFFKGQMFNHGSGVEGFFREYFNESNVKNSEIWTGAYNDDLDKISLFCNRGPEDSVFSRLDFDETLTQTLPPVYADGDIALISKASLASASIPTVVPPTIIDGHNYVDGAIFSASPLGIMQASLMKKVRKNKKNLHITYLNCMNLSEPENLTSINILQNSRRTIKKAIRCQITADRLTAHNCISHFGDVDYQEYPIDQITDVQQQRYQYQASLLEIYPTDCKEIDITNFTGKEVIESIDQNYSKLACRLWYVQ